MYQSRWETVHLTTKEWVARMATLVECWNKLDGNVGELSSWVALKVGEAVGKFSSWVALKGGEAVGKFRSRVALKGSKAVDKFDSCRCAQGES